MIRWLIHIFASKRPPLETDIAFFRRRIAELRKEV